MLIYQQKDAITKYINVKYAKKRVYLTAYYNNNSISLKKKKKKRSNNFK